MRIGLISDTHGLLRPEAIDALQGVDLILHAGDICGKHVLQGLRLIAPLKVVRGNNDFLEDGPLTQSLTLEGIKLLMIHELAHLSPAMLATQPDLIIFGHSHKPAMYNEHGITYLNPGAAGKKRFSLPISVAILTLGAGAWQVQFINLLDDRPLP